jgi:hypothetical protein
MSTDTQLTSLNLQSIKMTIRVDRRQKKGTSWYIEGDFWVWERGLWGMKEATSGYGFRLLKGSKMCKKKQED